MPLVQKRQLILIKHEASEFVGRSDGQVKKGFRLEFLDESGQIISGWSDTPGYGSEVKTVEGWEPDKASYYWFNVKEWQGVRKESLVPWGECVSRRQGLHKPATGTEKTA